MASHSKRSTPLREKRTLVSKLDSVHAVHKAKAAPFPALNIRFPNVCARKGAAFCASLRDRCGLNGYGTKSFFLFEWTVLPFAVIPCVTMDLLSSAHHAVERRMPRFVRDVSQDMHNPYRLRPHCTAMVTALEETPPMSRITGTASFASKPIGTWTFT